MKNLSSEELYFKETGDKATYRKDNSDYHTLKYVHWLEAKLNRLDEVEKDNKTAELEEQSKKLENAIEMVCKEIMGEERYGNSPCQAHPLQILEVYIKEKIAELEAQVKEFETILINIINLYSTTIDNLKCCGNCKLDRTPDCPKKDEWTVGCERCDNWQSDNQTKEESHE